MKIKIVLTLSACVVLTVGGSHSVSAQEQVVTPPAPQELNVPTTDENAQTIVERKLPDGKPTIEDMLLRVELSNPDINLNQVGSLFFTPREQSLLADARGGFVTRPPDAGEIERANNDDGTKAIIQGPRELALGGIVYVAADDWVIWLNGQRITTNAIPSEILDIKVSKQHIKFQWFDEYTNQIFPIKLRPHQRFNIDTRIFLPGDAG